MQTIKTIGPHQLVDTRLVVDLRSYPLTHPRQSDTILLVRG
jgi:hypothetical protein